MQRGISKRNKLTDRLHSTRKYEINRNYTMDDVINELLSNFEVRCFKVYVIHKFCGVNSRLRETYIIKIDHVLEK